MKKIILIGGGGHAESCIEVIKSQKEFYPYLLIDQKLKKKNQIKTILEKDFIKNYSLKNKNIHIGIGQLKNGKQREKIYKYYKNKFCKFPVIKSKSSYISKTSRIGEGTIIMHKVMININVNIGKNCIINSGSIIEHDVKIGNHVHIAPGAIILGGCNIGDYSFVGSGTVVRQNSTIKKKSILPSGNYFK